MPPQSMPGAEPTFLVGGGAVGALMRAYAWETTPFGPTDEWPQSLRTMLSVCLNAPMAAYILWGPDLRMFYNDAYIPVLGDRHPAALGRPIAEVWGESRAQIVRPFIDAAATGEGLALQAVEVPTIQGGDEPTYGDLAPTPIWGEHGRVVGHFGQSVDLTAQRLTDRAARDSHARVEEALSAGEGIGSWDWDVVHDSVRSDARFARLYGVSPELAKTGAPLTQFFRRIHREDAGRIRNAVGVALRTGELFVEEYRLTDACGAVSWVLARGQCELAADGTPLRFPGVSFDITARKRLEEALGALNLELEQRVEDRTRELVEAQEALRQAQKMEAVGQLTGGIAHDFNNLLQGITGSLQIARRRIAQGRTDDIGRFIDGALTSANRAAALIHRLLAFARRQPLDPSVTQPNRLIGSLADLVGRTIGPAIALRTVAAAGLWETLCDPHQLESSLLNLAINARDAMPGGGMLTIETGNVTVDSNDVAAHSYLPVGDYVAIAVTDTGSGMSPETIARAFEPFFTTKPMGQGTGLGLSMVYGFARQSRGAVQIESALGRGTTIKLYLPRQLGQAAAASPVRPASVPRGADAGETLLIVEDDAVVRGMILEVVRERGYDAIEAVDGHAGLDVLRSARRIDLLVTDIGLPGINGRDMADAGRLERPGLKVLFTTGYAENAALAGGFLEPGMAMLTKPFDMDDFTQSVRDLLTWT